MNENRHKIRLGKKGFLKNGWISYWVKPTGKFWKRLFNKRVRKGKIHKRDNYFEWS